MPDAAEYRDAIIAGLQHNASADLQAAENAYWSTKAMWRNDGYEIMHAMAAGWHARGVEVTALTAELNEVRTQLAAIRQVAASAVLAEVAQLRARVEELQGKDAVNP